MIGGMDLTELVRMRREAQKVAAVEPGLGGRDPLARPQMVRRDGGRDLGTLPSDGSGGEGYLPYGHAITVEAGETVDGPVVWTGAVVPPRVAGFSDGNGELSISFPTDELPAPVGAPWDAHVRVTSSSSSATLSFYAGSTLVDTIPAPPDGLPVPVSMGVMGPSTGPLRVEVDGTVGGVRLAWQLRPRAAHVLDEADEEEEPPPLYILSAGGWGGRERTIQTFDIGVLDVGETAGDNEVLDEIDFTSQWGSNDEIKWADQLDDVTIVAYAEHWNPFDSSKTGRFVTVSAADRNNLTTLGQTSFSMGYDLGYSVPLLVGNYVYQLDPVAGVLRVVNCTDPSNLTVTSHSNAVYGQATWEGERSLVTAGPNHLAFIYSPGTTDPKVLQLVSITSRTAPQLSGSVADPGPLATWSYMPSFSHNGLMIWPQSISQANSNTAIHIVDVSSPSSPTVVDSFLGSRPNMTGAVIDFVEGHAYTTGSTTHRTVWPSPVSFSQASYGFGGVDQAGRVNRYFTGGLFMRRSGSGITETTGPLSEPDSGASLWKGWQGVGFPLPDD